MLDLYLEACGSDGPMGGSWLDSLPHTRDTDKVLSGAAPLPTSGAGAPGDEEARQQMACTLGLEDLLTARVPSAAACPCARQRRPPARPSNCSR